MTIAVVQAVAKTALSSTITAIGGSNDRVLVVCVNSFNASNQGTITSVKLGATSLTQGPILTNTSDGFETSAIYYLLGAAAGQTSLVVAGSNLSVAANDGGVDIVELSGIALSSALDKSVTAQNTNTTYSIASGTLAQADEFIIGTGDGVSMGNASGWTTIGSPNGRATGYKIVSSTATQTFSGSCSSGGWVASLASFKMASSNQNRPTGIIASML